MAIQGWLLSLYTMGYLALSCTTQYIDVDLGSPRWSLDGCIYKRNRIQGGTTTSIICNKEDSYLKSPVINSGKCLEIRTHSLRTPFIYLYLSPVGMQTRSAIGGMRRFTLAGDSVMKANIQIIRPSRIELDISNTGNGFDTEIKSFRVGNSSWDCKFAPTQSPSTCESNMFYCSPGECINDAYKCDSKPDCLNGRDEANCEKPASGFNYSYLAIIIPIVVLAIVICSCCYKRICSQTGADTGINLTGVNLLDDNPTSLPTYRRSDNLPPPQNSDHRPPPQTSDHRPPPLTSDNLPPSYTECTVGRTELDNSITTVGPSNGQQGVPLTMGGRNSPAYPRTEATAPPIGEFPVDRTEPQSGFITTGTTDNQGVVGRVADRTGGPGTGHDHGGDAMLPDYDQVVREGFIELDPALNPELPERHPLQLHRLGSSHL